jgi:hypothetical protein
MGSENAHGAHITQRMASALTFWNTTKMVINFSIASEHVMKSEFHLRMMNPLGRQSSGHTHSQNMPIKFKRTSIRKLMATVFWDMKRVPIVEFMKHEIIMSQA